MVVVPVLPGSPSWVSRGVFWLLRRRPLGDNGSDLRPRHRDLAAFGVGELGEAIHMKHPEAGTIVLIALILIYADHH